MDDETREREDDVKYIIELEKGVYFVSMKGDPKRTLIESNARRYPSIRSATYGLANARAYRDFPCAQIVQVSK